MSNLAEEARSSARDYATQEAQPSPEITTLQIVEAFSAELNQLRQSHYTLEQRVARYDRIFESMFREEAERRLLGKVSSGGSDNQCAGNAVSELGRLQWQLRQQKGL